MKTKQEVYERIEKLDDRFAIQALKLCLIFDLNPHHIKVFIDTSRDCLKYNKEVNETYIKESEWVLSEWAEQEEPKMQEIYKYFKSLSIREKLGLLPSIVFIIFLIHLSFFDIILAIKIMLLDIIILFIIDKIEKLIKKGKH